MAHDLDFSRSDNVAGAAVFSVGETMWHREGRVVAPENRPRIVEDALDLAGINWTARKAEVFRAVGSDDYIEVPGYNVTLRSDTNAVLGMVRGRYTPLQNRDAFAILLPLIDNGRCSFASTCALTLSPDAKKPSRTTSWTSIGPATSARCSIVTPTTPCWPCSCCYSWCHPWRARSGGWWPC